MLVEEDGLEVEQGGPNEGEERGLIQGDPTPDIDFNSLCAPNASKLWAL